VLLTIGLAIMMASVVPLYSFFVLRLKLAAPDAAAIAATYGSISAVTFITATAFLQDLNITYSGYMVAAMALMESPAIIIELTTGILMKAPKLSESWKATLPTFQLVILTPYKTFRFTISVMVTRPFLQQPNLSMRQPVLQLLQDL
jgi:hypothetical protein